MKTLIAAAFLAAFVLQLTALPLYAIPLPSGGEAGPDFVLIAVAFTSMKMRPAVALLMAAMAGGMVDALSIDPPCTHVAAYVAAAIVTGWCRKRGLEDDALARLGFLAAGCVASVGAASGWLWLVRAERVLPGLEAALGAVLCDAALGAIVFALLVPLCRGLERKETTWFARA